MIEKCKAKNIYKDLFVLLMTKEKLPEQYHGKYDAAISSGTFLPGHLPPCTFSHMVEVVTIGGYIIFSMREKYYNEEGHKEEIEKILNDKKIRFIKSYSWIKYEGLESEKCVGVFLPDPTSVLVF